MRKHEDNGFYLFRGYLKEKDICGSRIRESWAFLESRKKEDFRKQQKRERSIREGRITSTGKIRQAKRWNKQPKKALFKNIKKYKKLDEKQQKMSKNK